MGLSELIWNQLHLSAPVDPDSARSSLVALATLSGSPTVVLQTVANHGRISWYVGAPASAQRGVLRALSTHLPGLRTEPYTGDPMRLEGSESVAAFSVRWQGADRRPLATEESPQVTRSLTSALAQASKSEYASVQVVLGPPQRPRTPNSAGATARADERRRVSEYGFGSVIRLAASAQTVDRAQVLARGLAAAIAGLEAPGARLRLTSASPRSVARAGSPLLWPLWLGVSDLVPLLGWPTAPLPLAGVPSAHPRQLPLIGKSSGKVLGVSTTDEKREVAITQAASLQHLHLVSPTGTGKSVLAAGIMLQDIYKGRGAVVIDPKGDLVADIARRIPKFRLDDVVIIDPSDLTPVGIDALSGDPDLAADTVLGIFHALYADAWGPRSHDILHASLLRVGRWGQGALSMVPQLLTQPAFRRRVLNETAQQDALGLGTFWSWFEGMSEGERSQAIAPIMNKLRPLTMRPGVRAMFGQARPRFHLREVFEGNKILLVSLAQGTLGPETSTLLGSLLVALVWQRAQGRAAVPASQRRPVTLLIDEVQHYLRLPGDLGDALATARGYGLGLILVHQSLSQLPPNLRSGVIANARSRVSFSLSPEDAKTIAATTGGALEAEDFRSLPQFHAYAQLLVDGAVAPPVSIRTRPLDAPLRTFTAAQTHSRQRYGTPRTEVEAELIDLTGNTHASDTTGGTPLGRVRRRTSEGDAR